MEYWRLAIGIVSGIVGLCLALPCILACLPFWGVRWVTKKIVPLFARNAVTWKEVVEFDGVVGWRAKSHLDVMCDLEGIREYHVKTDSRGFRGQGEIGGSEVVVFGDSFAFAHGVDDEKAFFGSNLSNIKITTIGSPGYNMVQELLLMEQLANELDGKLVVWFMYFGNDLHDNLYPNLEHYRTPFVRQHPVSGRWEIVNSHVNPIPWPFNEKSRNIRYKDKHVATFAKNFHSERVYGACEFLVKQGQEICQKAGANLVILTIPTPSQMWSQKEWEREMGKYGERKEFDPHYPDHKVKEICLRLGVPLIATKETLVLGDLIPMDAHWNEKGNAKIAKLIQRLYAEMKITECRNSQSVVERVERQVKTSAVATITEKLSEKGVRI